MARTAEAIWKEASEKSDTRLGQIRLINKAFREEDDSHLYPIFNKFNVTERAIRLAREIIRETGEQNTLAYALTVEAYQTQIVNDERNW